MSRNHGFLAAAVIAAVLSACGGGSDSASGPVPPPPAAVQYIAPNDNVFVAAIAPTNPTTVYSPIDGSYAGARLIITANLTAGSPTTHNQAGYAQLYKSGDGHLYRVNLLAAGTPAPTQVSSAANATIDDLCSLNGANAILGTDVNYVAVQSYVDFANAENSVYFYRTPSAGGSCGTAQDAVYMVKLGMTAADAPTQALMPAAVVHDSTSGAITGFVVNEGSALTLYDQNFQNRLVLFTPAAPITVAYSLASTGVGASGALFVLDGNIVYVDYQQKSVSAPLFTVPNWNPLRRFANSANASTEYFAVDTSDRTVTPVVISSAVYSVPLNGSAAPTALATESGAVNQVVIAIDGTAVAWSVVPPGGVYTIRTLQAGGLVVTALLAAGNSGIFVVTSTDIYYTTSTYTSPAAQTAIFSNTQTGIVAMDGTMVAAPVANSRFIGQERDNNGSDWLDIIRARNLSPVTVTDNANGITYTEDGISGATLEVVDTSSNAVTVSLGVLPAGTIMQGNGTLTATAGFLDGINVNSTANPGTRDLLYVDTRQPNSLQILSGIL